MSLFRDGPTRVYYGELRTAVTFDEYVVATAVAAGMLGLAWFAVVPTCKKKRTTLMVNGGYMSAVFVFVVAILGLTSKSWQSGSLSTVAPYSAYSSAEVNGTVGLYVGLESFNVTLLGSPEYQTTLEADGLVEKVEQINYNENIGFGVRQGRTGLSEYANKVNQQHRALQVRGVPYPIAWVIELFTNDGDGIRWGRNYRRAGYYAQILLWTSVPLWALTLLTLAAGLAGTRVGFSDVSGTDASAGAELHLGRTFLLKSQLRPAALLCALTGLFLWAAPVIYAGVLHENQDAVRIHFSGGDLTLAYAWTFWLTLCTGIVVFVVGVGTYLWCTWRHRSQLASIEYVWGDVAPRPRVSASEHQLQPHQSAGMHKRATSTSESRRAEVSRSQGTAPAAATSTGGGGGGGGGGVGATSSPAPSSSTPGPTTTAAATVAPSHPMASPSLVSLTTRSDGSPAGVLSPLVIVTSPIAADRHQPHADQPQAATQLHDLSLPEVHHSIGGSKAPSSSSSNPLSSSVVSGGERDASDTDLGRWSADPIAPTTETPAAAPATGAASDQQPPALGPVVFHTSTSGPGEESRDAAAVVAEEEEAAHFSPSFHE